MEMDFNLKLSQEQKLIMTQQMQLSVKMLQMSGIELKDYIDKEVQNNPVIDMNYNENSKQDNEKIDYKKFMEYLQFDNYQHGNYDSNSDEQISPFTFISSQKSLKDYLNEQILDLNENAYIKNICRYLIENLDHRGYLDDTIDNICNQIKAQKQDVEHCLNIIQSLDPDGIGARDLKECLKIQLNKKCVEDANIYLLVDNYLELLAENKIIEVARKLNISNEKAQYYYDFIKKLEPKPSRGFYTGDSVKYIIPDAYIRKLEDKYYIIMNDEILPKLKINPLYKKIILDSSSDKNASDYVKDKMNSAVFLIKSIEHRKSTIYRVLEQILEIQRDYFDKGKDFLKPMTLKEIAERIDMHESTVSRAIRDKYIYTNRGTIKIKDLFSTGLSSVCSSDNISSVKIKNKIDELVHNEDKKKPLSDQKICDILKREQIDISRRTVAKYREELGIKSSSKRKRF